MIREVAAKKSSVGAKRRCTYIGITPTTTDTLQSVMKLVGMLALVHASLALDNGLGLTPRLAFSTWNFFGTAANETHVHDMAAALERTGLKALGFDTINIDAGSVDRDPSTGKLVPSRHFPSGLRVRVMTHCATPVSYTHLTLPTKA